MLKEWSVFSPCSQRNSHLWIMIEWKFVVSLIIIYIKNYSILIGWEQCSFSLTQCRKEVIECKKGNKASILIGQWTKKFTDSQSNLLFSNQARALDGAIMAQFFLDCVTIKITWGLARAQNWEERELRVRKVQNTLHEIFSCILLIGNHTVFLVQFGINLHLWIFQKAKFHSPKRLV